MGTFSRIFRSGDKDLHKRADEILWKLSKALQSARAKLCVSTKVCTEGEYDKLEELKNEIITLERESDVLKDELVEEILTKHAYLPQQTQERHQLVKIMDAIIDACEDAVRVIALGYGRKPPEEMAQLGKQVWICTDLLQDAVKFLFKDFTKSVEITNKLTIEREVARNIHFDYMKKLFSESNYDKEELLLFHEAFKRVLDVGNLAEDAGDYIRELAVKYS
ncbi:MAG: DUF47 domain-containing protein [Candidatus Thorarchaeota archaeon]|jgi:predicted phosphate transport protein (TIGR00153 family)